MELKEKVTTELSALLGRENVIFGDDALRASDPIMVRMYEKAYGYEALHKALCRVKVADASQISEVLRYCNENDIHVVGTTGGSSSEDQLLVIDDRTIYMDAKEMDKVIKIDAENMMVTAQCGINMEVLEKTVNEAGFTTGHCPQSSPLASIGGLVATRSIGQFSTFYGGIEDLLCGLEAVLATGEIVKIRPVPRRSAGPDLRHLFLGCEGAWAFIAEVTLKLFPNNAANMWKNGYIVKDFRTGIDCIREIMVSGYKPAVVRLYDKADVDENYGSVKLKDEEAFMFFSVEGAQPVVDASGKAIHEIALKYGAQDIGTTAVDHWFETKNNICKKIGTEFDYERFRETGVYNSTIEICADWSDIRLIYDDAMKTLPEKVPALTMLGGHVSHSYMNGTNVYFVYAMKIEDPENATKEIRGFINELCNVVLKYETGTIVHHHGVGKVRAARIKDELGSSYIMLEKIKKTFDPNGIMNPECVVPKE